MRVLFQKTAIKSSLSRMLCLCLCFCFIAEQIGLCAPSISAHKAHTQTLSSGSLDKAKKLLPWLDSEMGHITDAHLLKDDVDVILIEDAHTNATYQAHELEILKKLFSTQNVDRTIYVEAAFADVSLHQLGLQHDKTSTRQVGQAWMAQGKLRASEYWSLISEERIVLQGMEDEDLYAESIAISSELSQARATIGGHLARMEHLYDYCAQRLLNPVLNQLLNKPLLNATDDKGLEPQLAYLVELSRALSIDIESFPAISEYAHIQKDEQGIEFKIAQTQFHKFIQNQDKSIQNELLNLSATPSAGDIVYQKRRYWQKVSELFQAYERSHENDLIYDQLEKYLRYLSRVEKLNTPLLLSEISSLESVMAKRLTTFPKEKVLYQIYLDIRRIKDVLNLSITSEQYFKLCQSQDIFSRYEAVAATLNQTLRDIDGDYSLALVHDANMEKCIRLSERFYQLCSDREKNFYQVFGHGLDRRALSKHSPDSAKHATRIVIAGGYHADGLAKLCKLSNVSYIRLMAKTDEPTDKKHYEDLLQSRWADYRGVGMNNNTTMPIVHRMDVLPLENCPGVLRQFENEIASALSGSRLVTSLAAQSYAQTLKVLNSAQVRISWREKIARAWRQWRQSGDISSYSEPMRYPEIYSVLSDLFEAQSSDASPINVLVMGPGSHDVRINGRNYALSPQTVEMRALLESLQIRSTITMMSNDTRQLQSASRQILYPFFHNRSMPAWLSSLVGTIQEKIVYNPDAPFLRDQNDVFADVYSLQEPIDSKVQVEIFKGSFEDTRYGHGLLDVIVATQSLYYGFEVLSAVQAQEMMRRIFKSLKPTGVLLVDLGTLWLYSQKEGMATISGVSNDQVAKLNMMGLMKRLHPEVDIQIGKDIAVIYPAPSRPEIASKPHFLNRRSLRQRQTGPLGARLSKQDLVVLSEPFIQTLPNRRSEYEHALRTYDVQAWQRVLQEARKSYIEYISFQDDLNSVLRQNPTLIQTLQHMMGSSALDEEYLDVLVQYASEDLFDELTQSKIRQFTSSVIIDRNTYEKKPNDYTLANFAATQSVVGDVDDEEGFTLHPDLVDMDLHADEAEAMLAQALSDRSAKSFLRRTLSQILPSDTLAGLAGSHEPVTVHRIQEGKFQAVYAVFVPLADGRKAVFAVLMARNATVKSKTVLTEARNLMRFRGDPEASQVLTYVRIRRQNDTSSKLYTMYSSMMFKGQTEIVWYPKHKVSDRAQEMLSQQKLSSCMVVNSLVPWFYSRAGDNASSFLLSNAVRLWAKFSDIRSSRFIDMFRINAGDVNVNDDVTAINQRYMLIAARGYVKSDPTLVLRKMFSLSFLSSSLFHELELTDEPYGKLILHLPEDLTLDTYLPTSIMAGIVAGSVQKYGFSEGMRAAIALLENYADAIDARENMAPFWRNAVQESPQPMITSKALRAFTETLRSQMNVLEAQTDSISLTNALITTAKQTHTASTKSGARMAYGPKRSGYLYVPIGFNWLLGNFSRYAQSAYLSWKYRHELINKKRVIEQIKDRPNLSIASIGAGREYNYENAQLPDHFADQIIWERAILSAGLPMFIYDANVQVADRWRQIDTPMLSVSDPFIAHQKKYGQKTHDLVLLLSVLSDDTITLKERSLILRAAVDSLKDNGLLVIGWYNRSDTGEKRRTSEVIEILEAQGFAFEAVTNLTGIEPIIVNKAHVWQAYRVTHKSSLVSSTATTEPLSMEGARFASNSLVISDELLKQRSDEYPWPGEMQAKDLSSLDVLPLIASLYTLSEAYKFGESINEDSMMSRLNRWLHIGEYFHLSSTLIWHMMGPLGLTAYLVSAGAVLLSSSLLDPYQYYRSLYYQYLEKPASLQGPELISLLRQIWKSQFHENASVRAVAYQILSRIHGLDSAGGLRRAFEHLSYSNRHEPFIDPNAAFIAYLYGGREDDDEEIVPSYFERAIWRLPDINGTRLSLPSITGDVSPVQKIWEALDLENLAEIESMTPLNIGSDLMLYKLRIPSMDVDSYMVSSQHMLRELFTSSWSKIRGKNVYLDVIVHQKNTGSDYTVSTPLAIIPSVENGIFETTSYLDLTDYDVDWQLLRDPPNTVEAFESYYQAWRAKALTVKERKNWIREYIRPQNRVTHSLLGNTLPFVLVRKSQSGVEEPYAFSTEHFLSDSAPQKTMLTNKFTKFPEARSKVFVVLPTVYSPGRHENATADRDTVEIVFKRIREFDFQDKDKVADVATGTGYVAWVSAEAIRANASVLDKSPHIQQLASDLSPWATLTADINLNDIAGLDVRVVQADGVLLKDDRLVFGDTVTILTGNAPAIHSRDTESVIPRAISMKYVQDSGAPGNWFWQELTQALNRQIHNQLPTPILDPKRGLGIFWNQFAPNVVDPVQTLIEQAGFARLDSSKVTSGAVYDVTSYWADSFMLYTYILELKSNAEGARFAAGPKNRDILSNLEHLWEYHAQSGFIHYESVAGVVRKQIGHFPVAYTPLTRKIAASRAAISCLICEESFPENENPLAWKGRRDAYWLAPNPYPIIMDPSQKHFVAMAQKHTPFFNNRSRIEDLLMMSRQTLGQYLVLKNGVYAGATIPAHDHFQLFGYRAPIYEDAITNPELILTRKNVSWYRTTSFPASAVIFESRDAQELSRQAMQFVRYFERKSREKDEKGLRKHISPYNLIADYNPRTGMFRLFVVSQRVEKPFPNIGGLQSAGVWATPDMTIFKRLQEPGFIQRVYRQSFLDPMQERQKLVSTDQSQASGARFSQSRAVSDEFRDMLSATFNEDVAPYLEKIGYAVDFISQVRGKLLLAIEKQFMPSSPVAFDDDSHNRDQYILIKQLIKRILLKKIEAGQEPHLLISELGLGDGTREAQAVYRAYVKALDEIGIDHGRAYFELTGVDKDSQVARLAQMIAARWSLVVRDTQDIQHSVMVEKVDGMDLQALLLHAASSKKIQRPADIIMLRHTGPSYIAQSANHYGYDISNVSQTQPDRVVNTVIAWLLIRNMLFTFSSPENSYLILEPSMNLNTPSQLASEPILRYPGLTPLPASELDQDVALEVTKKANNVPGDDDYWTKHISNTGTGIWRVDSDPMATILSYEAFIESQARPNAPESANGARMAKSENGQAHLFEGLEGFTNPEPLEDWPYFFSKESEQESVFEQMRLQAPEHKGQKIHVGVGGFFNLDIVWNRKSNAVVIMDANPSMIAAWHLIARAIKMSENRQQFSDNVLALLKENAHDWPRKTMGDLYPYVFARSLERLKKINHSWFSTEEGYAYVRGLFQGGAVFFAQADLTRQENAEIVLKWLRSKSTDLDTLYVSNLEQWIYADPRSSAGPRPGLRRAFKKQIFAFQKNLHTLSGADTFIMDSTSTYSPQGAFKGFVLRGRLGPPLIRFGLNTSQRLQIQSILEEQGLGRGYLHGSMRWSLASSESDIDIHIVGDKYIGPSRSLKDPRVKKAHQQIMKLFARRVNISFETSQRIEQKGDEDLNAYVDMPDLMDTSTESSRARYTRHLKSIATSLKIPLEYLDQHGAFINQLYRDRPYDSRRQLRHELLQHVWRYLIYIHPEQRRQWVEQNPDFFKTSHWHQFLDENLLQSLNHLLYRQVAKPDQRMHTHDGSSIEYGVWDSPGWIGLSEPDEHMREERVRRGLRLLYEANILLIALGQKPILEPFHESLFEKSVSLVYLSKRYLENLSALTKQSANNAMDGAGRGWPSKLIHTDQDEGLDVWTQLSDMPELEIGQLSGRLRFHESAKSRFSLSDLGDLNVYFVRHGETDGNVDKIFQGDVDSDRNQLNQTGDEQAHHAALLTYEAMVAQLDQGSKIVVVSSPLGRSQDTASAFVELATQNGHAPIEILRSEFLREINFGLADNKSEMDFALLEPPLAQRARHFADRYRRHLDATATAGDRPGRGFKHAAQSYLQHVQKAYEDFTAFKQSLRNVVSAHPKQKIIFVLFGHGTQSSALRVVLGDSSMQNDQGFIDWRSRILPNASPVKIDIHTNQFTSVGSRLAVSTIKSMDTKRSRYQKVVFGVRAYLATGRAGVYYWPGQRIQLSRDNDRGLWVRLGNTQVHVRSLAHKRRHKDKVFDATTFKLALLKPLTSGWVDFDSALASVIEIDFISWARDRKTFASLTLPAVVEKLRQLQKTDLGKNLYIRFKSDPWQEAYARSYLSTHSKELIDYVAFDESQLPIGYQNASRVIITSLAEVVGFAKGVSWMRVQALKGGEYVDVSAMLDTAYVQSKLALATDKPVSEAQLKRLKMLYERLLRKNLSGLSLTEFEHALTQAQQNVNSLMLIVAPIVQLPAQYFTHALRIQRQLLSAA